MNVRRLVAVCVALVPSLVIAVVPRCSPFIKLNKIAESTNLLSDSNPYLPVPPCEYGGPKGAFEAGDFQSIFHIFDPYRWAKTASYSFLWVLKTGIPRLLRVALRDQRLLVDKRILNEGYTKHYTFPKVRTQQLGFNTYRNPKLIENFWQYRKTLNRGLHELIGSGPDNNDEHASTPSYKSLPNYVRHETAKETLKTDYNKNKTYPTLHYGDVKKKSNSTNRKIGYFSSNHPHQPFDPYSKIKQIHKDKHLLNPDFSVRPVHHHDHEYKYPGVDSFVLRKNPYHPTKRRPGFVPQWNPRIFSGFKNRPPLLASKRNDRGGILGMVGELIEGAYNGALGITLRLRRGSKLRKTSPSINQVLFG